MEEQDYIRTTVYIRKGLRERMRGVDFNFSKWVNDCLEAMLDGSNEELAGLLNEERQLNARLSEVKLKINTIQSAPPDIAAKKKEYEEKKISDRKEELARRITETDPTFFLSSRKKFENFTIKELEGVLKKLPAVMRKERKEATNP